jgi:putative transposase
VAKKKRRAISLSEARTLVDPYEPELSVARQAELLGIHRTGLYYLPTVNEEHVHLDKVHMNAIDNIYTVYPFYGTRRMKVELHYEHDIDIGRERIGHLMERLGLAAIYPKPNLSKPSPENVKYPYLLRNLAITRPNQVWGSDITYIRTAAGFAYLVAFLDWYSRYVVSWCLSSTMESEFCIEALEAALSIATPEISNTDQGSQFTDKKFVNLLQTSEVAVSMDGRGRCMDNIFTERLWRSVKYENVYLNSYNDVNDADAGIATYFDFYNNKRRHQSLDYQTPASIYFNS